MRSPSIQRTFNAASYIEFIDIGAKSAFRYAKLGSIEAVMGRMTGSTPSLFDENGRTASWTPSSFEGRGGKAGSSSSIEARSGQWIHFIIVERRTGGFLINFFLFSSEEEWRKSLYLSLEGEGRVRVCCCRSLLISALCVCGCLRHLNKTNYFLEFLKICKANTTSVCFLFYVGCIIFYYHHTTHNTFGCLLQYMCEVLLQGEVVDHLMY